MIRDHIFLGAGEKPATLKLKYANRHGIVTGATGTGKTVTVQIMAEEFARAGVPVFVADVKGDLAGIAKPVAKKSFLTKRAHQIGLSDYSGEAMPTVFWDLLGKQGHPIRATVTEMGPLLLARMLNLNGTQEGILSIAYHVADDEGLPLLDLKDLRALLIHVGTRRAELSLNYGNISPNSLAAIQRKILQLQDQGADHFFGEPKLALSDFIRHADDGRGIINILAADQLMLTPKLYATFLLWLLSELFEELPELGDPDKPKLVFFFDEAHLLFNDAPKPLMERIEQVVRLIRSKGVGIFFATQNPQDIPDNVASQLGNRIQHALRAFTPKEQRVVRVAAETFRTNPAFNTVDVITNLGVGEALVSTLEKKGVPSIVQRVLIRPPSSRMGPISPAERKAVMRGDGLGPVYDKTIDRESAYEILTDRAEKLAEQAEKEAVRARLSPSSKKRARKAPATRRARQTSLEKATNQAIRAGTRTLIRELVRGLLGGLKRR